MGQVRTLKPKVIVYSKVPKEVIEFIHESCEVVHFDRVDPENYSEFLAELRYAQGIMGTRLKIDRQLLDQAPELQVVSTISVGYDNLNISELSNRNILATNTPDVLTETTADLIFGVLMATARRIPELDHHVKSGNWNQSIKEDWFGSDVHHKVLGIIGLGRIGAAIAKRGHLGFDMKVLYHNRSRNEEAELKYGAVYSSLEDLLRQSDFVCLMTPLSPETKHLISKREFALMKQSAIFINGSRGDTVNEEDLIDALSSGTIRAAGLDVYQTEPIDPQNPLLKLNNVVTLPHVGSATTETRFAMARLAAENLVAGVTGSRPSSLINPEVWHQGNKL
jgi:gluconate 2-dehydrogenase